MIEDDVISINIHVQCKTNKIKPNFASFVVVAVPC